MFGDIVKVTPTSVVVGDMALMREGVRRYYAPFESDIRTGTADVYRHEMPDGKYMSLREQARSASSIAGAGCCAHTRKSSGCLLWWRTT